MEFLPPSFDNQANSYDQRAGLSEELCRQIVEVVLSCAEVQPDDLVVEVGAGTGIIGQWFVQSPCRYIGFDLSSNMLEVYKSRLNCNQDNWRLVEADGNQQWPVADTTARVIFSSRAIHLLDIKHTVNELYRVASDRTLFMVGRIKRHKESVREQIRQQMQQQLQHHGLSGKRGEKNQHQLMELCVQRGGRKIEPVMVQEWKVTTTPQESLDNWQKKPGLGGINLPEQIKQNILDELRIWAKDKFGQLDQQMESQEAYILQGVDLTKTRV
ncbi:class I SAM-dependent methyltransferase [Anabaena azotica]|uniref:class I SAM-dependent methyltransferase n=1 Tax=Anabaena azotica TaxID=197653 RepID=UPI0039A5C0F5